MFHLGEPRTPDCLLLELSWERRSLQNLSAGKRALPSTRGDNHIRRLQSYCRTLKRSTVAEHQATGEVSLVFPRHLDPGGLATGLAAGTSPTQPPTLHQPYIAGYKLTKCTTHLAAPPDRAICEKNEVLFSVLLYFSQLGLSILFQSTLKK